MNERLIYGCGVWCSCTIIFKYKTALGEETKSIWEVWGIIKKNCKINYFDTKINDNWKTGSGNEKKND